MERVAKQLERAGISPERFRVESVSATEGAKWARIMREMSEAIAELGVEGVKVENEEAYDRITRRVRRMKQVPDVEKALEFSETARAFVVKAGGV